MNSPLFKNPDWFSTALLHQRNKSFFWQFNSLAGWLACCYVAGEKQIIKVSPFVAKLLQQKKGGVLDKVQNVIRF